MLSSNLLKGNWVQLQTDDARMIDSSAVLARRLHGGEENQPPQDEPIGEEPSERAEGFQGGLNAKELAALTAEEGQTLIKAQPPAPVYDGPSPEELIAQAQEEIAQMKAKAQEEIQAERERAFQNGQEEGKKQGYLEGSQKAQAELAEAKKSLEAAYKEQIRNLEPEFIKQLSGIYEHIFHVDLGAYHNLVTGLLESCMQKIESSSSYMIHVSREDYPYVSMQKKMLTDALGNKNAVLEVLEDASMRKNECMIEADSGIYDCSLDMQLDELRRELILLSYEGVK